MALAEDRPVGRFSLLGIDVRVNLSWLVMALLIAWSMATGAFPQIYKGLSAGGYWLMALLVTAGLGLSLLLHELAHTLVARAFGIRVSRITLFLLGGAADIREEPRSAVAEFAMAIAGPIFSVVASFALSTAAGAIAAAGAPRVAEGAAYLATLNFVLAAFNMIPAFPLDGGRVLRAAIWFFTRERDRATDIAAQASRWLALALMGLGFAAALSGLGIGALWWVLIGMFLRYAAQVAELDVKARRVLRDAPLGWVMTPGLESIPVGTTLDALVQSGEGRGRRRVYGIARDGAVIGVVDTDAVRRTPRRSWARTCVEDVGAPLSEFPAISAGASAADALERMRAAEARSLLVLEEGAIVGVVVLDDVLRLLEFDLKFAPRQGRPAV